MLGRPQHVLPKDQSLKPRVSNFDIGSTGFNALKKGNVTNDQKHEGHGAPSWRSRLASLDFPNTIFGQIMPNQSCAKILNLPGFLNRWGKKNMTYTLTVMGQKSCMGHLRLVLRCFLVQGFTSSNEYRRGPHSGDYLGKRGKPWYPDPFGFEDARVNPRGFHGFP